MKPIDVFHKLAGMGLTVEQAVAVTDQMLEPAAKEASFGQSLQALGNLSTPALFAAAVAPAALGYAGGGFLADQLDTQPGDIEAIQEQELIKELRANAQAALRRRALRGEEKKK